MKVLGILRGFNLLFKFFLLTLGDVLVQSRQSKGGQNGGGWARQSRPQGSQAQQQASRLGGNGKPSNSNNHRSGRSINCNSPHRHQVPAVNGGSGMRAVFLGGNGTGRESGGTGVFLPRTVGSGSESKRKPGNSHVLNNVIDVFKYFVITSNNFPPSRKPLI